MVVILSNNKINNVVSAAAADIKKATGERPKRPLSAYNLFYRFKREKILEAHKSGDDSKEAINHLIMAVPGLEQAPSVIESMSPESLRELRRTEILTALQENISPKDNRNRSHRKSHGTLSFLEMNKIMVASWKSVDDYTRSVFEELAEEGRRMYHKKVAEYEAKYPNAPKKQQKKTKQPAPSPKPSATQFKTLVGLTRQNTPPSQSKPTITLPMVSPPSMVSPIMTMPYAYARRVSLSDQQNLYQFPAAAPSTPKTTNRLLDLPMVVSPPPISEYKPSVKCTSSPFDSLDLDLDLDLESGNLDFGDELQKMLDEPLPFVEQQQVSANAASSDDFMELLAILSD